MTRNARLSAFVSAALCAAIAAGCAPRKTVKQAKPDAETVDAAAPGVEVGEVDIRGSEFVDVPNVEPVYFDYDAYSLSEEARGILRKNAEYLKANAKLQALVAGYCDERGTTEYNLALGQRRAKEVREYYIRLGVPGKNIGTISYGEEQPVCTDSTEDCWHQNRRAATRLRERPAAAQTKGKPKSPR